MNKTNVFSPLYPIVFGLFILVSSCNNQTQTPSTDIATTPEELQEKIPDNIKKLLDHAASSNGYLIDSSRLYHYELLQTIYKDKQYSTIWSNQQSWTIPGDSLLGFIHAAKYYGLFPEDYHVSGLDTISQKFRMDSTGKTDRRDAALWSRADVFLTDALLRLIHDVKLGHLPNDSISLRKDSSISTAFYLEQLATIQQTGGVARLMNSLEPQLDGYQLIKAAIPAFLDSMEDRVFTKVPSSKDPNYKQALQKRLFEGGYMAYDSVQADSVELSEAVKKYQQHKNITVDGKAGDGTIRALNTTDRDRFFKIAVSMDRYKLMPPQMPERYIWVNLPAFSMKLQDGDTIRLVSRVICGKVLTRTPLLNSAISEIITYPQWTPPSSIIVKEILPAVKKNPGYLAKKGFSLLDKNGDEVDPYSVDWSKYSKGIPYRVVQGSGDANALGVLKFNFPNKYAVYLHDTNQRYLFGQPVRAMSHGCVRVQEWEKLASYIIRKDRAVANNGKVAMLDSMSSWLARKEKHSIPVRTRLPVFIRYFTCEGKPDGKMSFYDDIYGEDKKLRAKYYAGR